MRAELTGHGTPRESAARNSPRHRLPTDDALILVVIALVGDDAEAPS